MRRSISGSPGNSFGTAASWSITRYLDRIVSQGNRIVARDINKRLSSLKARRSGTDRLEKIEAAARINVLAKSFVEENYQKRATSDPYTRYTLGAMQEVGPDYTRISIETVERVMGQLKTGLTAIGRSSDYRLQGSVPANLHIRGVSDVDLLALDDAFHTYDRTGNQAQMGRYVNPISYTSISALQSLRGHVETILKAKYPAADVDTSGSKAVKISGGSLARPVDVVPSNWHDTADYQRTLQEHDRGVYILDKRVPTTIHNMPFRHIKLINERDVNSLQTLKKAIRLCKNVKSDAESEGTEIALPSFDIAATMYAAPLPGLQIGAVYELAILAETQRYLDQLARNRDFAMTLDVPDGSRKIFDTADKFTALVRLSTEMDDLLHEVAKEQDVYVRVFGSQTYERSRQAIERVVVPTV